MRYWIVKFAPFRVSWEHILSTGKFEIYGVRNPQAQKNLNAMSIGDKAFYYHSQEGLAIMGEMEVVAEAHQDFTTKDDKWKSVTFEPVESFTPPISLATIKTNPHLQNIALVRQPRLAVSEINEEGYQIIKSIKNV